MPKLLHPVTPIAWLFTTIWGFCPGTAQAQSDYTAPYSFTTLAGTTSIGSADGPGSIARFFAPTAVASDTNGNLYVADTLNHTIRKISGTGMVSTLAGAAGESGLVDEVGHAARFNLPQSVAVDSTGNVYVADTANNAIRKITPTGVVTTLVGGLSSPKYIAVDSANNLLLSASSTIVKISVAGIVTTFAGTAGESGNIDGTSSVARFSRPTAMATDFIGNVYVVDSGNQSIRKITPTGLVSTWATGISANGIAVDNNGNVYLSNNFAIRKITPKGDNSIFAGNVSADGDNDGIGSDARFGNTLPYFYPHRDAYSALYFPPPARGGTTGLGADQSGNVFAADTLNNTIRKISPNAVVSTIAGVGSNLSQGSTDGTGAAARFIGTIIYSTTDSLTDIAIGPDGNVYLADTQNHTIRRISTNGVVTTLAGLAGARGSNDGIGASARFSAPRGIAVDPSGNIYVADTGNYTIRRITVTGVVTTIAGLPGVQRTANDATNANRLFNPEDVAVDGTGNIYVADNRVIRMITPSGTMFVVPGSTGSFDHPGQFALDPNYVEYVQNLAIDSHGTLYGGYQTRTETSHGLILYTDSSVRKFSADGSVTIVAGTNIKTGDMDGLEDTAEFFRLRGLAVDDAGTIYLADSGNHLIRRITASGVVSTLGGLSGVVGNADGIGRDARFYFPTGLALDTNGTLYVTSGTSVRKGRLATAPIITSQPLSRSVTTGSNVQFTVTASGAPDPTYQWYFNGQPFQGGTASTLSFTNARASDAGDYTVIVTNELGSVTSDVAKLTVTAGSTPSNPPSSSGGSGGGGGAPSLWFLGAVAALFLIRYCPKPACHRA